MPKRQRARRRIHGRTPKVGRTNPRGGQPSFDRNGALTVEVGERPSVFLELLAKFRRTRPAAVGEAPGETVNPIQEGSSLDAGSALALTESLPLVATVAERQFEQSAPA